LSSSAKKRSPQEGLTTGSGFSGSFGDFGGYYGVVGGSGGRTGGGIGGLPAAVTPRPVPKPTPTSSVPPIDDPIDYGSNDPADWPPFQDPQDPFIPPRDAGSAEPPEEDIDDLPEIVVTAPREPPPVAPPLTFSDASFPFAGAPAPAPGRRRRAPPRRSVPKPARRTRPVRPSPKPRIPIPVPPLPEVRVTAPRTLPWALVLTLVDPFIRLLGRVDRYGTTHALDRMFGPPGGRRSDRIPGDPLGSRSPDKDPLGDTAAPPAPDNDDLPTVIVTSPRPLPFSPPAPLPGPSFGEPGYLYPPSVPNPFRPPSTRLKPEPGPRFTVGLDAPQQLQPFPQPFATPTLQPRPRPQPSPSPAPSAPPRGGGNVVPIVRDPAGPGPIGRIDPVPDIGPVPLEELDRCRCPQKSKAKKRKQRTLCSRGSYVQSATGLKKSPTKYFDCATGAERPAPAKPKAIKLPTSRPSPMKKPKGGWPTNLKDLLNPKP